MKCLSCRAEVLAQQKFCAQCGARLQPADSAASAPSRASYTPPHLAETILTSRAALEGERKLVTVLFCDIANSTPLATQIGADAMHGLLNRFFELALAEVHRLEGAINQFLGDGFMALFGAPVAHEDHARRALLAALGIRQRLRDGAAVDPALRDIRLRMGVNTGMVVVGKIGDNLRMDYTAVGDTTHLAARFQQSAAPDTIRTGEVTRRAALAYFDFASLGKHAFKGMAEPVEVFDVVKVRTTGDLALQAELARIGSALVGRDRELCDLTASLDALRGGRGGVVILEGDPGAGKSRLVAEARRLADERTVWLEGRSLSFGRTLSYWPFIGMLKQYFGIVDNDGEAQSWIKLQRGTEALFGDHAAEITPYLATVLSLELDEQHRRRVQYLDPQALGHQVRLSMRRFFEQLAHRRPVLLLMEDWHWVDHSSIALCEHLLPLAGSVPLTFWFVARVEQTEPTARIRAVTGREHAPRLTEIVLAPLPDQQSGALLDNLIGAGELSPAVRGQILRKAEGNPFYIEEIVRALAADGTLVQDARRNAWRVVKPIEALGLPDTIQGVISARIDRLEDDLKELLKLASVIGRSFFLRVLEALADVGRALEGDLQRLEAAELIRQRQQLREVEYIFKHALVQEAAYGSIVGERRRATHRKVAQAIEKVFGDRLEEFTSLLAYHFAMAQDWEKAQAYLFKAGDQAGSIAADAEALEHYRQAEAAYLKVGGAALTPLERASLDRKLGQAFSGMGNYAEAVEHYSRALSHLGVRYPRGVWGIRRSTLKYLVTHIARRMSRKFGWTLRKSLDPAIGQEITAICRALAWLDFFTDQDRFGLDICIELDAGERCGDALAQARGLANVGLVLIVMPAFGLARRYLTEAVALAERSGHPAAKGEAYFFLGALHWMTGALDESERLLRMSAQAYQDSGDLRGWGGALVYHTILLMQRARMDEASANTAELIRVGRDAADSHVYSWGINGLGWLAWMTGPLDQAVADLTTARETAARLSSHRVRTMIEGMLGKCYLRQGRFDEARHVFQQAIETIKAKNLRGFSCADPFSGYAELCLIEVRNQSGPARAKALREASRACRQAVRCARGCVTWLPEALRLQGTLAILSGREHRAIAHWEKSISLAEQLDLSTEKAQTLLEMGSHTLQPALVDRAIAEFTTLGMKVDLALALHARARLAADGIESSQRKVDQYEAAIAALEEVRADYALGLARVARARLLEARAA